MMIGDMALRPPTRHSGPAPPVGYRRPKTHPKTRNCASGNDGGMTGFWNSATSFDRWFAAAQDDRNGTVIAVGQCLAGED